MRSAARERLPGVVVSRGPVILAALAITVLAWPISSAAARPGLDRSWEIALHLAAWQALRQGVDFVFTFGPLGFLSVPHPFVGWSSVLALIASGAVYLGLVVTVLVEARRVVPLWAAALLTLAVARMFAILPPPEAFQVLVFAWAVEAVAGRLRLTTIVTAVIGGVLAGIALMVKIDTGVFILAMGAVAAATIDRPAWRGLLVYSLSAVATALAAWLATGQRLEDVGAFVAGAYQIVSGFSQAMALEDVSAPRWPVPVFLLVVAVLSWLAWRSSRAWPSRRRIGLAVIWAVFAFAQWKIAIVRGHPYVYPAFAIALFPLAGPIRDGRPNSADRRIWLMAFVAMVISIAAVAPMTPDRYLDAPRSVGSLAKEVRMAVLPGGVERAANRTRRQLRARYALPPGLLSALAGHRVQVDPDEAAVGDAFPEMSWAPLPVFQTYSAYTTALDELNAARLRSTEAPDRILRYAATWVEVPGWLVAQRGKPVTPGEGIPRVVDGRFRWFESPTSTLETFCRYQQVVATERWQVLERTGRMCGQPEPIATVVAREGETVDVPVEMRPDRFVVVRIHGLEPTLTDQAVAALYRAPEWFVTLDDGVRYRLVQTTAGDGLLLAVPPSADGTGSFAFGPPIRSMSVRRGLTGPASDRPLTYEFLSVAMIAPDARVPDMNVFVAS